MPPDSLNHDPLVTVVMPVYNGGAYLPEAIESILRQTFTDLEFLIVDDASTDNSRAVIGRYDDARITLRVNETNLGVGPASNAAIAQARGTYIAIMNGDDISFPHRLEKQVAFMEANPCVGVCGSFIRTLGLLEQECHYATDSDDIVSGLLFNTTLVHPTIMLRKKLFAAGKVRYNSACHYTEDYDLWRQFISLTRFANLPEVLLGYRLHSDQSSVKHHLRQRAEAKIIRRKQIEALGINPTPQELSLHQALCDQTFFPDSAAFVQAATAWLRKLLEANNRVGYYPKPAFAKLLSGFYAPRIGVRL